MDIISIIVLTGIINLTFSLYSWQQVSNPESHAACKPWAQAEKTLGEPLTFNLGACASSDADTVQDLMRKADVLLYQAKRES